MNCSDEEEYQARAEQEFMEEWLLTDPIRQSCRYVAFVSKSKGRRNGKQRRRKHWKEVCLIKYRDGKVTQWHHFPFDRYATEIFGSEYKAEDAEEKLRELLPSRAMKL